jgi:hypothetical protein
VFGLLARDPTCATGLGVLAFALESAFGRTILPVFRHQGQQAMSGRLTDQVAGIANEASVREEL